MRRSARLGSGEPSVTVSAPRTIFYSPNITPGRASSRSHASASLLPRSTPLREVPVSAARPHASYLTIALSPRPQQTNHHYGAGRNHNVHRCGHSTSLIGASFPYFRNPTSPPPRQLSREDFPRRYGQLGTRLNVKRALPPMQAAGQQQQSAAASCAHVRAAARIPSALGLGPTGAHVKIKIP